MSGVGSEKATMARVVESGTGMYPALAQAYGGLSIQ